MQTWSITGFAGINNMQDPSNITQPKASGQGTGEGLCELVECINFDIDDTGSIKTRDVNAEIFTKQYSAKLIQRLRGRKFRAVGNKLLYTKPFSDEDDPKRNSITYPALITMIQEVEDGLWVSTTEKIYFHSGHNPTELGNFSQNERANYAAIMGTSEKVPANKLSLEGRGYVAVFATTHGICIGDSSGNLTNVSYGTFSYTPGQRGISLIRESGGMIQYQVKMINDIGDSYNQQDNYPLDMDII